MSEGPRQSRILTRISALAFLWTPLREDKRLDR